MNYYPFHIGDYLRDTAHLTPFEDITYRRLLDMYYLAERPIPKETQSVARRLRLEPDWVISVLKEFFVDAKEGWLHRRCEIEIKAYNDRAARARTNGKAGGRPKKTSSVISGLAEITHLKTNQNQNQNQNHIIPIPQKPLATPSLELLTLEANHSQDLTKIEVGSWFNRRPTTAWSEKENKAWLKIAKPINPDDWQALKWFYTESGCRFLRRDLQTLLNNWTGEIDRAKNYNPEHP